eukprot:861613-Amphidinium_carterae.1
MGKGVLCLEWREMMINEVWHAIGTDMNICRAIACSHSTFCPEEMVEDAEAKTLFKGAPVRVRGLQNAAEWNGCKGRVTAGPFDNGRFEVSLQAEGATEPKVLSLKPGNIQLDTEALTEYLTMRRQEQPKRQPPLHDIS